MRIARCAILGVFCLSGIQSAVSAGPPAQAQGRGAGQISPRGLDRSRFSPEVSRALQNRARVETRARVDTRGNVGGIGQASAASESRVGAQFGTGRLGGDSGASPAERGPGRRNVLDRFSRRDRREDRPDRMDRPAAQQNSPSRGRSEERPPRGLFSSFLSTEAEAAVNGRKETDDEIDDDAGERRNRGNRGIHPRDRGFRPTAQWLLNKRLARIDHLRDVALANGNTRLMEKADELEALARLQYERRIGVTGDDPAGDDPVGDDPVSDDPVQEDPIGDDPISDEPISNDPVGDDPASSEPTSNEPVTLGFEEFSTLDTTTTTSDATLDTSTEFRGRGRFGTPSGPANGTGFGRFEQATAFEGETAPFAPVPGRAFGAATSESAGTLRAEFGRTTMERARADGRAFGHSIADSVRYRPSEPEEQTTQTFRATANTGIEAEGQVFGTATSEEARRLRSEFGFATQESARISGREFGATTSGSVRGSGGF